MILPIVQCIASVPVKRGQLVKKIATANQIAVLLAADDIALLYGVAGNDAYTGASVDVTTLLGADAFLYSDGTGAIAGGDNLARSSSVDGAVVTLAGGAQKVACAQRGAPATVGAIVDACYLGAVGGGGGSSGIGGSIAHNQVALGASTANSIQGSDALKYDGTSLSSNGQLNIRNDGAANNAEVQLKASEVVVRSTGAAQLISGALSGGLGLVLDSQGDFTVGLRNGTNILKVFGTYLVLDSDANFVLPRGNNTTALGNVSAGASWKEIAAFYIATPKTTLAAAATIQPISALVAVTGAAAPIATIDGSVFENSTQVVFLMSGAGTFATGGNIDPAAVARANALVAAAVTAGGTANVPMAYDADTNTWF